MIFKILEISLENILYSISFYKEIEEVLDYGFEFNNIVETKHIDYLYSLLKVVERLSVELREQILYRYLITEFKEEYFTQVFEQTFLKDLELVIAIDDIENTFFEDLFEPSDLDSWYYNSD